MSAAPISNGTRPQDPGGGESVLLRTETVGVSAVLVDATLSRMIGLIRGVASIEGMEG